MNDVLIALTILSQLSLGVYSWLIKTVPTNLSTQLLARMSIFTVAALALALITGQTIIPSMEHLVTLGPLNILHVASSYYAYSLLPTTVSIPLFYIYPFINVYLSSALLNNNINLWTLPFLLLSFIGVIVIVFQNGQLSFSSPGLIAILIAAITESLIYITFKSRYSKNNYDGLFHLYAGGLIAILLARATNIIEPFDFNPATWKSLTFFITFIGFAAFAILTYCIPLMSSELYASLAFFGVLSAYIFGHIGAENVPTIKTMIGSGLIVAGATAVRYLS